MVALSLAIPGFLDIPRQTPKLLSHKLRNVGCDMGGSPLDGSFFFRDSCSPARREQWGAARPLSPRLVAASPPRRPPTCSTRGGAGPCRPPTPPGRSAPAHTRRLPPPPRCERLGAG